MRYNEGAYTRPRQISRSICKRWGFSAAPALSHSQKRQRSFHLSRRRCVNGAEGPVVDALLLGRRIAASARRALRCSTRRALIHSVYYPTSRGVK